MCKHRFCNVPWYIANHFLCSCACDMDHESTIKYRYYHIKKKVSILPHEAKYMVRLFYLWSNTNQWCTGSGFWSPIRPDIRNVLEWIGYRFPFNRIQKRIIQMKKFVPMQKNLIWNNSRIRKITIFRNHISNQNRRQKVVNRGALRLCVGELHSCRGAWHSILKNSTN